MLSCIFLQIFNLKCSTDSVLCSQWLFTLKDFSSSCFLLLTEKELCVTVYMCSYITWARHTPFQSLKPPSLGRHTSCRTLRSWLPIGGHSHGEMSSFHGFLHVAHSPSTLYFLIILSGTVVMLAVFFSQPQPAASQQALLRDQLIEATYITCTQSSDQSHNAWCIVLPYWGQSQHMVRVANYAICCSHKQDVTMGLVAINLALGFSSQISFQRVHS